MEKQAVKIFISYAEKDKEFYEELMEFTAPMRREGSIELWDSSQLMPGDVVEDAIKNKLNDAQVILFLVSPSLLNSDDIHQNELLVAIERYERKQVVIVPVLVRPTYTEDTPLSKFRILPDRYEPIAKSHDRDEAWLKVVESLKYLVISIQNNYVKLKAKTFVEKKADNSGLQFSTNIFETAKLKLSQGEPEQALKILVADGNVKQSDTYNNLLLLYARFHSLEKDKLKGIISHTDAKIGFNQVNDSLLQTIDRLQEIAAEHE